VLDLGQGAPNFDGSSCARAAAAAALADGAAPTCNQVQQRALHCNP
jgi:hypothetical protein